MVIFHSSLYALSICNNVQTLGSIVSCFGFTLVLVKSFYSKSVAGVSLKSLQCFLVVYVLRLIAICFTQAYLPYDKYSLLYFLLF